MSRTRPRLLLFITELDRGGAERAVLELAAGLNGNDFTVEVAVLRDGGALRHELAERGVKVLAPLGRDGRELRALASVDRLLADGSYSVLHSHLPEAGVIARAAAIRHRSCRTVYTEHNLASGYGRRARVLNCLSRALPDVVVSVSEAVRRSWRHCPRAAHDEVIPNGVRLRPEHVLEEDRTAARRRWEIDDGRLVLGTVANLHPRKGHRYLLEACANLVPSPLAKIILIGDGPERRQLERLAEQKGLTGFVEFMGVRNDAERLIPGFDLFVLPSVVEGLPVALLEAMACGVACVATNVGGVPEVIRDGVDGVLVAARDPAGLRSAIRQLSQRQERARIAEQARPRVENAFSTREMVERYGRLYERILSGPFAAASSRR